MNHRTILVILCLFVYNLSWGAIDFDNTDPDSILILDSASLSFTNSDDFSISAWIKPDSCDDNGAVIWEKDTGAEDNLIKLACDGGLFWFVRDTDEVTAGSVYATGVSDGGGFGLWHHVVGTRSGDVCTIWVDGRHKNSKSGSYTGVFDLGNIRIGVARVGGTRNWEGELDDIRVYKRLLSDAEIQVLALSRSRHEILNG